MEEDDLDMLLAVIGNPTRRQILRKLVKEEHYPLQLSRELQVSQEQPGHPEQMGKTVPCGIRA